MRNVKRLTICGSSTSGLEDAFRACRKKDWPVIRAGRRIALLADAAASMEPLDEAIVSGVICECN